MGAALCILLVNHQFNDLVYLSKPNSSINGTVISLPQQGKFSNRFEMRLKTINNQASNAKVLVYWPGQVPVKFGDQITAKVKSRPLHSSLNQGGFNYQRYLVAHGVIASVTILNGEISSVPLSWLEQMKANYRKRLTRLHSAPYILALALGDRSLLEEHHWATLKATGTGHLFAISGLHLSLVAMLTFWLFNSIYSKVAPQRALVQRPLVCGVLSVAVCFGYAYISGFALPTQRAFITLCVLLAFMALKQRVNLATKLGLSLLIILLVNPNAMLSASFWLSFGAIALIYALVVTQFTHTIGPQKTTQRVTSWLKQLLKMQLWLFVGLLGINLTFFSGLSLIAPIANLVAVPVVSLLILPLILITLVAEMLGAYPWLIKALLLLIDECLSGLVLFLTKLQGADFAWLAMPNEYYVWLAIVILTLLLASWQSLVITKARLLLCCSLSAALFASAYSFYKKPMDKYWQVTFLDVGQGNAAVITRQGRAVIVDTGKRYSKGSAASRIIEPYLTTQGITDIDYIIATHDDTDHSGGLADLAKSYPDARLISNQTMVAQLPTRSCAMQETVTWMGLSLQFAQVPLSVAKTDNDRSCLVRISGQGNSVLFVGDIQKKAEQYFSQTLADSWQSDVLQIAHHGSKTSSSTSFLEKIAPKIGIISSSRFNQWHFPHPMVMRRLNKQGVESYLSARDGQISVSFGLNRRLITTYRGNIAPFWYNRDLSFGHYD